MMTAAQLEILRAAILRVLSANDTGRGFTPATLAHFLRQEGFNLTAEEVFAEIRFLEGAQFVTPIPSALAPALRSYRITLKGSEQL